MGQFESSDGTGDDQPKKQLPRLTEHRFLGTMPPWIARFSTHPYLFVYGNIAIFHFVVNRYSLSPDSLDLLSKSSAFSASALTRAP